MNAETGPSPPRIAYIDGLRGTAMLLVLGYHHWGFLGNPPLVIGGVNWIAPLQFGYAGVHLFLVLSGCFSYSVYLLHHPFGLWLHHHFYAAEQFFPALKMAVAIAFIPGALAAGYGWFLLLEKPFLPQRR